MKKTYLLILAAIALIGCSKHNPDNTLDPDAWISDESLPVPIMFGAPGAGAMTKAMVTDLTELHGKDIGVFGLDMETSTNGYWYTNANYPNPQTVLLNNQASAVDSDGRLYFKNAGGAEEKKYYPLSGGQNFSFFAYYPKLEYKTANQTVGLVCDGGTTANARYVATYEIGHTDILWAKAVADNYKFDGGEISGYNAAYVRKVTKIEVTEDKIKPYLPNFAFEHLLTAVEFTLQSDQEAVDALAAAEARVVGLSIDNTYKWASFTIADNAKGNAHTPTLTPLDKDIYSIYLKNSDSDTEKYPFSIDMKDNATKGTDGNYTYTFGNGLLLLPNPADKYFETTLYVKIGDRVEPVKFKIEDPNLPSRNFAAGYKYHFTIIVKGPKEVVAYATLKEWQEGSVVDPIDPMN